MLLFNVTVNQLLLLIAMKVNERFQEGEKEVDVLYK